MAWWVSGAEDRGMVDLGEPRRAGVADVDGVLRLRELMLGEMGADVAT